MNSIYTQAMPSGLELNAASPLSQFSVIRNPKSKTTEAFRSLQTQIYLNWLSKPGGGSVIAVVSADRQDGRSFVASNLAVLFAQGGMRCLLIDGDMRFPAMHRLFGLPHEHGLANLLNRTPRFEAFYSMQELETLTVLPVGIAPENPQALLQRESFAALIDRAANNHDVVILDTPASALFSDAQVIARIARGALLVCRKNHTRASQAASVVSQLASLNVHTIGTALMGR